jgi:D-alanyl-lipoteichoic acid acyltransferase DltB (MBOAT superfamily)
VLWIAVIANLGLLGYFKYYNFFAASLMNAFDAIGVKVDIGFIEVALPIAISFLTFHALSYIIEVYRRAIRPTTSLIDIMFYIGFFPHLIAGPIVRAPTNFWRKLSGRATRPISGWAKACSSYSAGCSRR